MSKYKYIRMKCDKCGAVQERYPNARHHYGADRKICGRLRPCPPGEQPPAPKDDLSRMSQRKFYRSVFTVEVLSEEPIDPQNLEGVHYLITEGDCSGQVDSDENEEVDARTMAGLLIKQGSDPGFFRLNEDGTDADEDSEE